MPRFKGSCGCYNRQDARELGLAPAIVWNDMIDRAEHFDMNPMWYDQKDAAERLGMSETTLKRAADKLVEAGRITKRKGYRPGTTTSTTWVTILEEDYDTSRKSDLTLPRKSDLTLPILKETKENETETKEPQNVSRMKPEALYARVHSFFKGPNEMRKQKVQAIKQLQEEYELSDKTILDGMKAISENKTIKFENGDEFTFTLTHLLLRSDLEKTATLLVRKAEELATKKPVSDKLKTFVKITDM